ncbi:hypothetical protein COCOBI_14-3870 [Coccomyxa sp. Obi]|nr:hypothetical protein COCOBI_14-3870 [Coccomyxa sp. Obi]
MTGVPTHGCVKAEGFDRVIADAAETQRGATAATGVYGGSGTPASPAADTPPGSKAPPPSPVTAMGTGTGTHISTPATTKTPARSPAGDIRPGTAGTTTGGPGSDQASSKTATQESELTREEDSD